MLSRYLKYSLVLIFMTVPLFAASVEEEDSTTVIQRIFADLRFKISLSSDDILTDLQTIDRSLQVDFEKQIQHMINQLATQRGVYSMLDMNEEKLQQVFRSSLTTPFNATLKSVRTDYLNLLNDNDLINSDDRKLYLYLLGY